MQGVGYRRFVRRIAAKYGIKGHVRNMNDGSVEVFAEADSDELGKFEKEINISTFYGPQVFNIERFTEDDNLVFKGIIKQYSDFVIEDGE